MPARMFDAGSALTELADRLTRREGGTTRSPPSRSPSSAISPASEALPICMGLVFQEGALAPVSTHSMALTTCQSSGT
ncbi:hypothetical protein D9M68_873460 [compost metagenome]